MTSTDKPAVEVHDIEGADLSETGAAAAAIATTAPIEGSVVDYARNYMQRVRGGDMGSLPVVCALIVLVVFFRIVHPTFGGLSNFANLFTEGAGPIFIAMGIVFVLLLAEIDLSAGYAAGVCAMVMVRLMTGYHAPWPLSIGSALVTGVVIGLIIGLLRAKVRIPSFVVTLALFLAFQGVALYIASHGAGPTGDIPITDKVVNAFDNGSNMTPWMGWLLAVLIVVGFVVSKLITQIGRRHDGLVAEPVVIVTIKIAALAIGVCGAVYALNLNRSINKSGVPETIKGKIVFVKAPPLQGVPWVVPVVIGFFALWTFVLSRTRYGRHIYAVGGNEEAARRAGINVDRVRISVFVLCSLMASVGGIMIGSNIKSVSVENYGGNVLLLAIAAAVIGGTSLFGGKGRMVDALIGGMVVEVISNGTADLINSSNPSTGTSVTYVVTGAVLLVAAAVDALSRRRAGASGLG